MTNLGPAEKPPSPEQLLAALKKPLSDLIATEIDAEFEPEKVWQYNYARRNALFFRGLQFLAPDKVNGVNDYVPIGGMWGGGANGQGGGADCYDYTRNIIRGFGNKFIAVIGQRSPNVTAVADDPQDEKSMKACRQANEANAILNAHWDVDERNIEIAFWVWTTGPAYIYTPWNADGEMYGYRQEPKYRTEQQPMGDPYFHCVQCGADSPQPGPCPQCGMELTEQDMVEPEVVDVPVEDGYTQYPNGRVECYVLDCTTVSTPFHAKRDLRYCPWLDYTYEENRAKLIKKWPELRNKPPDWSDGTTTSIQGKETRAALVSPTGVPQKARTTRWKYSRKWLQADQYALIKEDQFRKLLEENFPEGIKISRVNGEIMELEPERLDKVWSAVQPSPAPNLNADPVCTDLISAQQLENHVLNIGAETIERGNALTFADPRVINFQQWNAQSSKPNSVIPTLAAVGQTLADSFWQTQPSRFSDQMMPWISGVVDNAVEDVGTPPAIFGSSNAGTAREAEINKNAAMMQLGLVWTYFRKGWAQAKTNGIMQMAKYGTGTMREGQNMVDLAELTAGGWHLEAEEAIPSSWGQQRDFVQFMMTQPPEVQAGWGMQRPENIPLMKSLMGMVGLYTPGLDDRDSVIDLIQQLLQGEPVQKQNPDGSTTLEPSIPIDDFVHDANLVVQVIQGWAQKASLTGGIRETNPGGYSNVLSFGKAYRDLMNAPPPPPPAPPIAPKLSVSISSKDLAMNQTQALLGDANLQVPPPEMPPMSMMPQGPPVPPDQPQGPPATIQ
jgi:hypothetical protein